MFFIAGDIFCSTKITKFYNKALFVFVFYPHWENVSEKMSNFAIYKNGRKI